MKENGVEIVQIPIEQHNLYVEKRNKSEKKRKKEKRKKKGNQMMKIIMKLKEIFKIIIKYII